MHPHVRETLYEVLRKPEYEGVVTNMYLDRRGLVTIGIGFLIDASKSNPKDPAGPAVRQPFVYKNSTAIPPPIRDSVIRNEFKKVKGLQHLKGLSGAFGQHTTLKIEAGQMMPLFNQKVDGFLRDIHGVSEFSHFDTWPADAQLGLLSWVYAGGIGLAREYVHFRDACAEENFLRAANECEFSTTPRPFRNQFNRDCFVNAAFVLANKDFDKSRLLYSQSIVMYLPLWHSDEELKEIYNKYPKLRAGYKQVFVRDKGKFFTDLYKKFPELKPKGRNVW